jgi:hypothetical protein
MNAGFGHGIMARVDWDGSAKLEFRTWRTRLGGSELVFESFAMETFRGYAHRADGGFPPKSG